MSNKISISLAKAMMKIFPNYPTAEDMNLQEIFRLDEFKNASKPKKEDIKRLSSKYRYDYENQFSFFNNYFPNISNQYLEGKTILDLGCFTGGRLINWMERYNIYRGHGIDIDPVYADAATNFANSKGANTTFETGYAENLPYSSNYFDVIISSDVFEHVKDVEMAINECFRVLKPGGRLLAVFPPFFQPLESHLGLVTKIPAMQWLFSGKTIAFAYNEILTERGREAYWYNRKIDGLEDWERSPYLNGITVGKFRKIISKNKEWEIKYWRKDPILSDGRKSQKLIFRFLRLFFIIPARLPILEELFLSRIGCILEKGCTEYKPSNF